MRRKYDGLPAAPSVEQAIIQAQRLLLTTQTTEPRRHRVWS